MVVILPPGKGKPPSFISYESINFFFFYIYKHCVNNNQQLKRYLQFDFTLQTNKIYELI